MKSLIHHIYESILADDNALNDRKLNNNIRFKHKEYEQQIKANFGMTVDDIQKMIDALSEYDERFTDFIYEIYAVADGFGEKPIPAFFIEAFEDEEKLKQGHAFVGIEFHKSNRRKWHLFFDTYNKGLNNPQGLSEGEVSKYNNAVIRAFNKTIRVK